MTSAYPERIVVRDVGPRDGLQAEAPVEPAARVRVIEALVAAGVTHMEICSFVSPKAVPSMAGADQVVAAVGVLPGVTRTALVPNLRGAELALAAGVDDLTVTVSASATYNQRNVHMTIDESVASVAAICEAVRGRLAVDAVLSFAFGSPYEGDLDPAIVVALAERLIVAGADSLTYADTTGMATPRRIEAVLAAADASPSAAVRRDAVGLHLHETRGTALVNAHYAMGAGVRRFDTSVGGLGGSPFAAGAAGNLATEDLVYLCDDLGIDTGIDLDRLLDASAVVAEVVGHAVPSRVALAGPRLGGSRAVV